MRGYWNQFLIPFKGMKVEKHTFRFEINREFFEHIDGSLLEDGNVMVELEMDRQANMLVLDFFISGYINLKCDRCLDEYRQAVEGHRILIVKFSPSAQGLDESEDIIVLPDEAHEIDVGQHIYEFINLLIPIKHVHEYRANCNKEMLKKLDQENENDDAKDKTDERWKALEELKKNMKNN